MLSQRGLFAGIGMSGGYAENGDSGYIFIDGGDVGTGPFEPLIDLLRRVDGHETGCLDVDVAVRDEALDELLVLLDRLGIEMVDELEFRARLQSETERWKRIAKIAGIAKQ